MASPLPPVPGVFKLTMKWGVGGTLQLSTNLHFQYSGSIADATPATALATALRVPAAANIPASLNSGYTVASMEVTDLSVASGPQGTETSVIAGTRSGPVLPLSTAAVANYAISRRYRGGKPRSFVPFGIDTDLASNQVWGSSALSAFNGSWSGFLNGCIGVVGGGATVTHQVNVSYFSGFTNVPYGSPTKYRRVPTPRSSPLVDVISSSAISAHLGSQPPRNPIYSTRRPTRT